MQSLSALQGGVRLLQPERARILPGLESLRQVETRPLPPLQMMTGEIDRVTISGGGDPSCYPEFIDLIELLAGMRSRSISGIPAERI